MKLRSESSWSYYKKQTNICTSLRKKAIGCYFQSKAHDSVTKPQEFWKIFGPIFRSNKLPASSMICLLTLPPMFMNLTMILPAMVFLIIQVFILKLYDNFCFKSTNLVIVIRQYYDNIPVRLVKDGAGIIGDPLAKLFNTSVFSSGYPP